MTAQPRHTRRNLTLFFLDSVFFGIAFGLIGNTTVVPDFVRRLTDSETVVGLISSIYLFAWLLPQLFMAQIINRSTNRLAFMTRTVIPVRLIMAGMAIAIAVIGAGNSTTILIVFLVGYILFAISDGFITLVWADLLGNLIPERWRGVLFSISQIVTTVGALITREVARHLLGPNGPAFPQNYAQLFGIAAALFFIAGIALTLLVEDKKETNIQPGPTLAQYLPYLGNVLRRDREFQKFVITRLLLDLTMIAAPFYIVFGSSLFAELYKVPREQIVGDLVGNSILLSTVGAAAGALLMSGLSHRYGSRAVIGLSALASCLHPALALLSFAVGPSALYGALFVLGFVAASAIPGYFDWIITYAPPDRRPIYVGLTNTISAISHLAPFFGGLILTVSSYQVLFGLAIVIGLLGLISVVFLTEPRKRNTGATLIVEEVVR
ncbi:MAG: MFS transporter [Chloroflexota bacterium]